MEFLGYLATLIVGYALGQIVLAYKIKHILVEFLEEEDTDDVETVHKLKTELMNGTLFLYDSEDTFVCQGSSLDELAKFANEIKHIKYAAVMHDNKIFTFIDGIAAEKV